MAGRLQEIFEQVVALRQEERDPYLKSACGTDQSLRAEIDALLRAHDQAASFLSSPTGDGPVAAPTLVYPLREGPGTRIGPYKLLQLIGEGGFGSVFMAEQEKPVQRRVALKIIKLGMDTHQVVARFEQERQALAMMDHPNIAKVLDAGATETGRPYFVMELVKGDPIVEYADKNNLSIEDRLELFAQVCTAVQHAHTKGIIHRDIKPSNILVSTQDGRPHTKVIDFGIAKATASKLTEKTLFTEQRALIGTPEYMSPEQAEGSLDIDTRTDVYSLGVLLYELLTGTTPFSSRELRSAAYAEIQRIIREVEPPKPSTRLSHNTDTIAGVAAKRHVEPKKLGTIIRGELDWIVMKSLEKDRQRRYETANGLAMDVRRYLTGEAVLAAPPSTAYRLKKFIRRNRPQVIAAALVALALVAGLAGTAWQAREAARQRDAAVLAGQKEGQQRAEAEQQRARANERAIAAEAARKESELTAEFMSEMLEGAGPSVARGRDITMLKEMMDGAAARIEKGDLKGAPGAELRLRGTIGNTYRELAQFDSALRMIEPSPDLARSLYSGDNAWIALSLNNLATVRQSLGRAAEAEPLYEQAHEMKRRLFPGDHPDVAEGLNNLANVRTSLGRAAEAEPLFEQALEMYRRLFPGDHPYVATSLSNLAGVRQSLGRAAEAEPLYDQALEMRRRLFPGDHPDVAASLNNLASVRVSLGRAAEAEPLFEQALEMTRRLFPGDHPRVAASLNNLAFVRDSLGRAAEAEPLYEQALEMRRRLFPGDHPDVANSLNNLAAVRGESLGRAAEAEPLYVQALEMRRRLFPGDHPGVANSLNNLAFVRRSLGRAAEAEPLYEQALEMYRRLFPDDHPSVAWSLTMLASVRESLGRAAEAEPLFDQALEMNRRVLPRGHPDTRATISSLAKVRDSLSRPAEAEVLWRELLELQSGAFKPDDWRLSYTRSRLGGSLLAQLRFAEAEPLLVEGFNGLSASKGTPRKPEDVLRESCERVVKLYGEWDKAEPGKGFDAKADEWKGKLDAAAATTENP